MQLAIRYYFNCNFVDTLTGKLFRTSDLSMVVEFFLMFHKDKPVDWLMDHILWVKVCNPEKDTVSYNCDAKNAELFRPYAQHWRKRTRGGGKMLNV